MPSCTKGNSESRKRVDYFQRRKVGSIRDNPKLLKIRQQFENASKENCLKDSTHSTTSSISKTNVLGELLKKDFGKSTLSTLGQSDGFRIRRNSESAIGDSSSSVSIDQNANSISDKAKYSYEKYNLSRSVDNRLDFDSLISLVHCSAKNNALLKSEPPLSLDSALTQTLPSEKAIESPKNTLSVSSSTGTETSSDCTESTLVYSPPPLPKRGLSPATQSFLCSSNDKSKQNILIRKELFNKDTKEAQNVQKTIELYEGMSSGSPKKNKPTKSYGSYHKTVKRGDSFSRVLHKTHHGSRRNSFRKSKPLNECSPTTKHKDPVLLREESDGEEGNNNIYQTLSTTEVIPNLGDDPYDRLNRIHDVLHQIHKGQTSSCAACRAIPSSVLQLQETAFLKVKCHEASPHHHPPCICFSCQHSVFSCSTDSDSSAVGAAKEDGLYYNLCCLNPPNHESWRQSRRRPICEQNGRLCVVNCDIEKTVCAKVNNPEKNYENLSNYLLISHQQQNPAKQATGDSCESDEGWVDESCFDSEDDKSYIVPDENWTSNPGTFSCNHSQPSNEQSKEISCSDVDGIVTKCSNLNLSHSLSTEHLYESINEMDSNEVTDNQDYSADNCNYDSKIDQALENDLDSGEWSTESESPVFNESFNESSSQKTSLNQCRFLVGAEMSDTAKKTFMKSVLGKKVNHSKKRKMSNFFVPWLVSNNEYYPTGAKNEKLCSNKLFCSQTNFCKQSSISGKRKDSSNRSLSRSSPGLFSSEVLNKYKTVEPEKGSTNLSENSFSSPEATPSFSSR